MNPPKGQQAAVLAYIIQHDSITSMEAFEHLGVTRLSAVVYNLKRKGYNIKSEPEQVKTRYGATATISRYSLCL